MINLFDEATGQPLGKITEAQLQVLRDQLEEESADDDDYYVNRATVELLERRGADADLVDILRSALGTREEMDVRFQRDETA